MKSETTTKRMMLFLAETLSRVGIIIAAILYGYFYGVNNIFSRINSSWLLFFFITAETIIIIFKDRDIYEYDKIKERREY